MSIKIALTGACVFDGHVFHENSALLMEGGQITDIVPVSDISSAYRQQQLAGGMLVPGFIDLQTNGGGGVQSNDKTTLEGIEIICAAHIQLGTTALLPTYITDVAERHIQALEAGIAAKAKGVAGFLGLHLEGPHISKEKKGAHSSSLIRRMTEDDVLWLCQAAKQVSNLMITIAPEVVDDEKIRKLKEGGVCVSLGHSNATAQRAQEAFQAGAGVVTHLFNAMSGLAHREPGLVGAALNEDDVFASLICDGHHVLPEVMEVALCAKNACARKGRGKIFLISDSMSLLGTDYTSFDLNGRTVTRQGGQLTLQEGTLAGADLDLARAMRYLKANTSTSLAECLKMASLYPAQCLGVENERGQFVPHSYADIVHLDDNLSVQNVWVSGELKMSRSSATLEQLNDKH